MKPTTPIIILLLILWLIAFQVLPRVLAAAIAIAGQLFLFFVECAIQLYGQRQMLRPQLST